MRGARALLGFCALLLACAVLLTSCQPRTSPVERATEEGILLVGNGPEPATLDPVEATGVSEQNILRALYEGLVAPHPQTLEPLPAVAAFWEVLEGGLRYRFHLREDARWSDGTPVVAADFERAFRRALEPGGGARNALLLFGIAGAEATFRGQAGAAETLGVRAVDAQTLELRLEQPLPHLLSLLMHPAFSPEPPRAGLYNGPFVLSDWRPDQVLQVRANPAYRAADAVTLSGIDFFPIADLGTEERAFLGGQLHVTEGLPPQRVAWYRQQQPEVLRVEPYLGTYYYMLNTREAPLDDRAFRQKLSAALDREGLVALLDAGQTPAYSFVPPGLPGYTPPQLTFDRAAPAEASAEGGAERLQLLFNTSESHRLLAEAVQSMWAELDVRVVLDNVEWGTYLARRSEHAFEVARAVWIADYPEPSTFLDLWRSDSPRNYVGFDDDAYDRLLDAAAGAEDPAERARRYAEAEQRLLDAHVLLPVYHYVTAYLKRPEVQGWAENALDWPVYQAVRLER